MVNKKTNRYYRRAYQAIYKRPTIPQDKKLKEKEENIYSQKSTKCSKRKKPPVPGNAKQKKMSKQL